MMQDRTEASIVDAIDRVELGVIRFLALSAEAAADALINASTDPHLLTFIRRANDEIEHIVQDSLLDPTGEGFRRQNLTRAVTWLTSALKQHESSLALAMTVKPSADQLQQLSEQIGSVAPEGARLDELTLKALQVHAGNRMGE